VSPVPSLAPAIPAFVRERWSGRSALVTGGAGFIGSHLVDAMVVAGFARVHVVDDLSLGRRENLADALAHPGVTLTAADCAQPGALDAAVGAERYDVCFNLAVIPLPHSLVEPAANVERNVAMTTAVCELGRAGGFERLVQFSSSEVYGTAHSVPMAEDHPLLAHTPYAAAKAATDLVARSYATTFGLEVVTVRPFNTYGERQNDAAYAGLIPAVVNRVLAGEPVVVHGDGMQTRDMTHVGDTVLGTLAIASTDAALGLTLNLGSGREASVLEMVRLLLKALGAPEHPVEHVAQRPGDVRRLLADTSLAERLAGYRPRIPLSEGLARTVTWYVSAAVPAR
jgi:UDP-glucose 4-epimerase